MLTIEERVSRIEEILIQVRENLREFQRATLQFQAEWEKDRKALYEDVRVLKEDFQIFKEEMRNDRRENNKRWGELANKMGTLVEDLVAPALRPVLKKYFQCDPILEGQRIRRRKGDQTYEVDALVVSTDLVFLVEVRSSPRVQHIEEMIEKMDRFFFFFPEYEGKRLIPILASLSFPGEVLRYGSKKKIYLMGWKEWEYMDILNFEEISQGRNPPIHSQGSA